MSCSAAARTPSAVQVIDKVYKQGYGEDQMFHDHFAFRTFGVGATAMTVSLRPLAAASFTGSN